MSGGRTTTTGWYLHHHGSGHLARFRAVRPHLAGEVVVFSSLPEPADLPDRTRWVLLDRDDTQESGAVPRDPQAAGLLHWAPIGHRGYTNRMAAVVDEARRSHFERFVVDVSVEITALVRLLGVPPVVFGQPGVRDDLPHRLAYQLAECIVAPWPEHTHPSPAAREAPSKTVFVGGISRHAGRDRSGDPQPGSVLVLGSAGGTAVNLTDVRAAAAACPETAWTALGLPDFGAPEAPAANDAPSGAWVPDPWTQLCTAEVVISFAGQNAVADIAAAGARALVLPQDRPFDEQGATARALASQGFAEVRHAWPIPVEWPDVLTAVRALTPRWDRWQTDGAAERAATAIAGVRA